MKNELLILAALVFTTLVVYVSTLLTAKRGEKEADGYLLSKYVKKTEREILEEKLKDSKYELLEEIKMFDVCLKKSEKTLIASPFARAFFSKAEEFSEAEIISLLEKSKSYDMLDLSLVDIFLAKNYDRQNLKSLFYESAMSVGAKEKILECCEFSKMELERICFVYDNSFSVLAMKKLLDIDENRAFAIAKSIVFEDNYLNNANKLYIAALGISVSYKAQLSSEEDKTAISERIKEILRLRSHLKNDLARTQLICVLANNNDFDDFRFLVSSEDIEQELKVSLIEKNVDLILDKINRGATKEELDCILHSMSIYPVKEVGDELRVRAGNAA